VLVYDSAALFWALAASFVFLSFTQSVILLGREISPVAKPLPTQKKTTQTQNKRTQTSMPHVGLEPTFPVFERAKTVHPVVVYVRKSVGGKN
jgi:hypothetical protein